MRCVLSLRVIKSGVAEAPGPDESVTTAVPVVDPLPSPRTQQAMDEGPKCTGGGAKMKAVLQYGASPGFRTRLAAETPCWLDVVVVDVADKDTFAREMKEASVLLHVLEPVTMAVINGAPNLRLIQKIGVGVNTIDLDAARARSVRVANMPGTNSRAVAEMTLALMFSALRRVTELDRLLRGGGWNPSHRSIDGVGEVCGRTVGLVGLGAVGSILVPILQALGAEVVYTDVRPMEAGSSIPFLSLDALLSRSDVVSLHLPLTPDTQQLLNAERIASMSSGAVLINTSRGGLVDEQALVDALRSGHLRAAGLDVFAVEPTPTDNPLLQLDNVVVTPHLAWLTPETLSRSMSVAFENCHRIRDGEQLLHQVV